MTKEECWRATLVDRMHGHDVTTKELVARSGVQFKTLQSYMYALRQPGLYNGLKLLDALGVKTVKTAL